MKNAVKTLFCMMVGLIVAMSMGLLLMIGVYQIPTNGIMKDHAKTICNTYQSEGTYPMWADGYMSTREDNFADATMLLIAIDEGTGSQVKDAVLNSYHVSPDSKLGREMSLVQVCEGNDGDFLSVQYGRYWHGYLLWMKPLLLFISATTIRMLGCFLDMFLAFSVLILIRDRMGIKNMWAMFIAIAVLNPVTIGMSFQFKSVFDITMVSLIVMLKYNEALLKRQRYLMFFMTVGIVTAFLIC